MYPVQAAGALYGSLGICNFTGANSTNPDTGPGLVSMPAEINKSWMTAAGSHPLSHKIKHLNFARRCLLLSRLE